MTLMAMWPLASVRTFVARPGPRKKMLSPFGSCVSIMPSARVTFVGMSNGTSSATTVYLMTPFTPAIPVGTSARAKTDDAPPTPRGAGPSSPMTMRGWRPIFFNSAHSLSNCDLPIMASCAPGSTSPSAASSVSPMNPAKLPTPVTPTKNSESSPPAAYGT